MLLVLGSAAGRGRTAVARLRARGCAGSATRRSSRCSSPLRGPESQRPCSGSRSGSGSGATGSRLRCSRSSPSSRAVSSPPGRSPDRRSSTTAPARRPRRRRRLVRSAAPRGRRARRPSAPCSPAATRTEAARAVRSRARRPRRRRRRRGGDRRPRCNAGRIADEFRGAEVRNDPTRFTSLSSNNRSPGGARRGTSFEPTRSTGAGANTFEVARKRYRENGVGGVRATQCPAPVPGRHGARRACALPGARGRRRGRRGRRSSGGSRGASEMPPPPWPSRWRSGSSMRSSTTTGTSSRSPAPRSSPPAFWPQPGRPARRAPGLLAAAGAAALALAAIVSVATPWLADRELRQVNVALDRGDLEAAGNAVERARSLDPLSLAAGLRRRPCCRTAAARRGRARRPTARRRGCSRRTPSRGSSSASTSSTSATAAGAYRAPERGLHARPGRQAVDARRPARPRTRLGERRELQLARSR